MSRATEYLTSLRNYEDAAKYYEKTKPIRGHGERRPLGRRRDHTAFWMRKDAQTGNFECMCYRTPVITFRPDNTVVIVNGNYASATTHSFISYILRYSGVDASTWQGKTRLTVDGHIHLLSDKDHGETATLVVGEDRRMRLAEIKEVIGCSMDRKAANNVRRRYKEFADYFVGMVKLRTQVIETPNRWDASIVHVKRAISLSMKEIVDAVGATEDFVSRIGFTHKLALSFDSLTTAYDRGNWYDKSAAQKRPAQEAAFLACINPDQPEETKMGNYHKAALLLMIGDRAMRMNDPTVVNPDSSVEADPDKAVEFYDRALLMANAKEVLTLTKLAPGKMPNPKYVGWIRKHNA